jgi:predicted MFS family arabinose efflux permease
VAAVSAALFVDSLLYSVVVPVLPAYAGRLGASPTAIGALFAAYAAALLLATPVFARVADRMGRRWPLVLGSVGVAGATLLFAVATAYPALVAARAAQGAAAAAVWTSGIALVAELVPAERLGQAMGTVLACMSAGLIAGPPVGGVLVEAFGHRAPFLACAAVAAAVCLALLPLLGRPGRAAPAAPAPAVPALLRDPAVRGTLAAVVLGAAALSMLEPLLPVDLAGRLGAGSVGIGLIFGAATLAHGVVSPLVGRLADRCPRARLIPGGLLAMAAFAPFLGLPRHAGAVAALLVGFAVAYSFVLVPVLSRLAEVVRAGPGEGYATVYGLFNITYAVGKFAGPLAGGAAAAALGVPTALTGLAAVLAVAAVLLARRQHSIVH